MSNKILIYGANGYTGRLITKQAINQNLNVELAGRNSLAIGELAEQYQVKHHIVELNQTSQLKELLQEFETVIHCAGPFSETALPMVEACLATSTNYLDITGEISVFEMIMRQHDAAKSAEVALIPGIGFDVVPTDCLTAYVFEKMPDAKSLELAFVGSKTGLSRGTAVTMVKNMPDGGYIRKNGKITKVPLAYEVKEIEFPHKKQWCMTIPWGDLMTAYHQTGIPNIKVFSGVNYNTLQKIRRFRSLKFILGISWIQKIVRKKVERTVTGPTAENLELGNTYIMAKVINHKGEQVNAYMITPEAYQLTALTAVIAAKSLTNSKLKGYYTPAQAFGKDFIMEVEGVIRQDET